MVEITPDFFKGLERGSSKGEPETKDPTKCNHVKYLKEMFYENDPDTGEQKQIIKCSNCGYIY